MRMRAPPPVGPWLPRLSAIDHPGATHLETTAEVIPGLEAQLPLLRRSGSADPREALSGPGPAARSLLALPPAWLPDLVARHVDF